jgi:riboflavin kinase
MSSAVVKTAAQVAAQNERPPAALHTEEFRAIRPQIVGPETPEPPFPILLSGPVQKGFGRGGKDLGCPTGSHIRCVWNI